MKLGTKFSLLLSTCVLVGLLGATAVLSRFFASDQESYMNDRQSTIALFAERELRSRLSLLHAQMDGLIGEAEADAAGLVSRIPGAFGLELWEGSKLIAASLPGTERIAPVPG